MKLQRPSHHHQIVKELLSTCRLGGFIFQEAESQPALRLTASVFLRVRASVVDLLFPIRVHPRKSAFPDQCSLV